MNLHEGKIGSYSYSCLMAVILPEDKFSIIRSLTAQVSPSDINWGDGNGAELDPHITALYGIHEPSPEPFITMLRDRQKFMVRITGLSTFDGDEYDVLKLDVESPELTALNAELRRKFKYTSKFPDYMAHATIAYLKKGTASKYLDLPVPHPYVTIGGFEFSSRDEGTGKVSIPCAESLALQLLSNPK